MGDVNVKKGSRGFLSRPLAERFWEKVTKTETCWLWTGATDGHGYGIIWVNGRKQKAHRVSLGLAGVSADGKEACHRCDNPPCVNPDHLFVGTHQENMRDAVGKGRVIPPHLLVETFRPHNAGMTHCKRGHEFTPDNTIRTSQGRRSCRQCQHMHQNAYDKRRRHPEARRALEEG